MAVAVFIVRAIFLLSLILAAVAGLSELEVLGNGSTFGIDSLRVMLWAGTVAVFTSPILVTFVFPWQADYRTPEDEEATP